MSDIGGWTPETPVTPEVEKICCEMKSDIEKFGIHLDDCTQASSFRTLYLMGATHYLVKVNVRGDVCIHAMIVKLILPCVREELILAGVQFPKNPCDPLIPFDD